VKVFRRQSGLIYPEQERIFRQLDRSTFRQFESRRSRSCRQGPPHVQGTGHAGWEDQYPHVPVLPTIDPGGGGSNGTESMPISMWRKMFPPTARRNSLILQGIESGRFGVP
jgi:hypothetical protein